METLKPKRKILRLIKKFKLGNHMLFSEFLFIIEPFFILSMIGLRHQTIAGMFPKKITHMGRKGPRAKTKTVLKSVSKWELFDSMPNLKCQTFAK